MNNSRPCSLRALGVRWYAPVELGEVVPRRATIAVPDVNKAEWPLQALRKGSLGPGEDGEVMILLGIEGVPWRKH